MEWIEKLISEGRPSIIQHSACIYQAGVAYTAIWGGCSMVAEMGSADRGSQCIVGLFLSINLIVLCKKHISECHPCIIQVYIMHISGAYQVAKPVCMVGGRGGWSGSDRVFPCMLGLLLSINPIIRVKKQISGCHPCIIQVYIMHISGG